MSVSSVGVALDALSAETRELCGTSVERRRTITAIEFLREYVGPNRPVVITEDPTVQSWRALKSWPGSGLRTVIGGDKVTVNVTPNGRADAVVGESDTLTNDIAWPLESPEGHEVPPPRDGVFTLPEERQMTVEAFYAALDNPGPDVFYVSKQNNSMNDEFAAVRADAPEPAFALAALGEPEATNVWIGDERSVTSTHRDFFENIYVVVAGEKRFTLFPPVDAHRLPAKPQTVAKFCSLGGSAPWRLVMTGGPDVPWITVEPEAAGVAPLRCTVRAGEILFLPSLWYHEVRQESATDGSPCVAVNFWHDMKMGTNIAVLNCITALGQLARSSAAV